jgi:hypothetical protein
MDPTFEIRRPKRWSVRAASLLGNRPVGATEGIERREGRPIKSQSKDRNVISVSHNRDRSRNPGGGRPLVRNGKRDVTQGRQSNGLLLDVVPTPIPKINIQGKRDGDSDLRARCQLQMRCCERNTWIRRRGDGRHGSFLILNIIDLAARLARPEMVGIRAPPSARPAPSSL